MKLLKKLIFIPLSAYCLGLAVNAQADSSTVAEPVTEGMAENSLGYWTRQMIAELPPVPMPVDTGEEIAGAAPVEEVTDPPGSVPGVAPDPDADEVAKAHYPEDWSMAFEGSDWDASSAGEQAAEGAAVSPEGTSQIYLSYHVNRYRPLWKKYPHLQSGRFASSGGSCSAKPINSNIVVTAAHCVYNTDNNTWYSNKVFIPAYRNGAAPYGTFPTAGCRVLANWVNLPAGYSINTYAPHDVAVCKMGTNSVGKTINQMVGGAGYSWNYSYTQAHFNNGYPWRNYTGSLLTFRPGQYLRSCTGESFQRAAEVLGSGCNWGPGISGGAWERRYAIFQNASYINSVNSGLVYNQQNLYGPRFNTNNIKALCDAHGC
jgi:hypothetical protein